MQACPCVNPAPSPDCWICGGAGVCDPLHRLLIETKSLLHVSMTGAGPRLLEGVWDNPGISEYFVGGFIPYRRTETHGFLGHEPEGSYVSADVAFDMASESYVRASETKVTEGLEGDPIGLGISAAVASNRWPKGGHRAHVVIITKDRVLHRRIDLVKSQGKEARQHHDEDIARAVQSFLRAALEGAYGREEESEQKALDRFYLYPVFDTDGMRRQHLEGERNVYLPATLNPIHDGHRAMCRAAEEALSEDFGRVRAHYLVSSVSPHKGRLSVQEMLFKAGMLRAERWRKDYVPRTVEFTHDEPLFLDKARKRPGSRFIIGADTMQRMLDPKWGPAIEPMLKELTKLETMFYVMGRIIDDKWVTCRDVEVIWPHQLLFRPLEGRVDVSSTELREKA